MIELLAISGTKPTKGGQVLFDTWGSFDWVVPEGVTSICACSIATGLNSGAGGGLSYRNNIPVQPGETLTVVIPNSTGSFQPCGVKRGQTMLVVSYTGNYSSPYTGGAGGLSASTVNDGGGNGGDGFYITLSGTPGPIGGGAGGYSGKGGNQSQPGQGGGGGGGNAFYQSPNRYWGTGGGTGIIKQGPSGQAGTASSSYGAVNGKPGSNGIGQRYGGGRFLGTNLGGAVRIIWGADRSYPNMSDDIVE
ncbi:MAG: hypothetical protein ACRC8W_06695 [Plesiomonas shigelloides]